MDKETAKKEVERVVKRFLSIPKEKMDSMPEEDIKFQFIEPLFDILGWKRENISKETRILKGRADYILKIGNQNKLVIEAKKTNVRLSEEEGRQAVSYAHHKNIKFAILTNFKQLRVYHALSNIKDIDKNLLKDDKGYLLLNCENFIEQFDRLWLLSEESFEKEEIYKLLENVDKRLIRPIDEAILTDLLQFREWLSKDLKDKRTYLSDTQIDEIVQMLIDRLIFMRSVEDRGLEEQDFLLKKVDDVQKGRTDKTLWASFIILFKIFDKEYNSKLFSAGLLEKEGFFEEKTLIKVIKGLYYGTQDHQERYRFDDIPVDLLGGIYEQYLGVVLKGTEKRVKLDLTSGKRKKMGIYYTPAYVVDYIIKNTVEAYIKDKSIDEILNVNIVDPACGSGSFLIKAFECVCNVIEDKLKKGERGSKALSFHDYSERLSLGQKATILTSCIYGVDLDEKAVELAQLNLLLKILEEETRETRKRILPNMKDNIKNGNSLIEDYKFAGDKAFKWEAQFPEVFRQGGFDIVVGNPPYINAIELTKTVGDKVKDYWKKRYLTAKGTYDIYILFFEQAFNITRENGLISFITPNKYLSSPYGVALRELIAKEYRLIRVLDLSKVKVFNDPSVYPVIVIIKKFKEEKEYNLTTEKIFSSNLDNNREFKISSKNLTSLPENIWGIILSDNLKTIEKIFKDSKWLEGIAEVQATSTASEADEYSKYINENKKGLRIINTGTIDRYNITYGTTKFMNKGKQLMQPYLDTTKVNERRNKLYTNPKIIIAKLALRIEAFLDENGEYASINTNCIHSTKSIPLKCLIGIINSKLMSFTYSELFSGLKMGGGYFQFQAPQLRILPIKTPEKKQEEKIISLVEKITELNAKITNPRISGNEKEKLEQQIKNLDYEIDEEVYKLYGLNKEEIEIIENS